MLELYGAYPRRVTQPASPRVLVVDDEPQVRATVREALAYEGYDVSEAENGAAALESIARSVPDLVIFDLWMPVMDGWQLRKKLSEAHPGVPVIVLSALELEPAKLLALEADALIEKPFDLDVLYRTVSEVLARHA